MNKREQIARALCSVTGADPDAPHIDGNPRWHGWEQYADAVLAAMREPTEEMLAAAKPEPTHLYRKDGRDADYEKQMKAAVQTDRLVAASIWRAMIGAAA